MNGRFYLIMADCILVLHTLIVLFNVLGLILIWIGYFGGWGWVRNFYFRMAHLGCMGFIAVQTLMGAECPLTVWENNFRVKAGVAPAYNQTFIGHWLNRLLFYEVSLTTFAIIYALVFALFVFTWFQVKPNRLHWWRSPVNP